MPTESGSGLRSSSSTAADSGAMPLSRVNCSIPTSTSSPSTVPVAAVPTPAWRRTAPGLVADARSCHLRAPEYQGGVRCSGGSTGSALSAGPTRVPCRFESCAAASTDPQDIHYTGKAPAYRFPIPTETMSPIPSGAAGDLPATALLCRWRPVMPLCLVRPGGPHRHALPQPHGAVDRFTTGRAGRSVSHQTLLVTGRALRLASCSGTCTHISPSIYMA